MNPQQQRNVAIAMAVVMLLCACLALALAGWVVFQSGQPIAISRAAPVPAQPPSVNGLNAEGFRGPTTAEAKNAIALDVQRLRTEVSAFVWRSVPNTVNAKCPRSWVCTLHLADDSIKVFVGDDQVRAIKAGTFRFIAAYPSNDAVHGNPPCELLRKEQVFGAGEDPSFPVSAGNFTCVGGSSTSPSVVTSCPSFGGVATRPLSDGGCKFGPQSITTAQVPQGYWAAYWDGSATRQAQSGATITTGEATFYQNGK